MDIVEYNLRNTIGYLICFISFIVALIHIINDTKKRGWAKNYFGLFKYSMIVLITLFNSILVFSFVKSFASPDESHITVEVTHVIISSGFGGFSIFENSTIFGLDDDGNERIFSISLFSTKQFKEQVRQISIGDRITFYLANEYDFYNFVFEEEPV
jgi:hypothetical protein